MRKTLYIISLYSIVFSCSSQKFVKSSDKTSTIKNSLVNNNTKKTVIEEKKVDKNDIWYYTKNIADTTKNDNTISYGSIVQAKPQGYKVVKKYFPAVAQNFRQKYLILHYTALPDDKSIRVLTQQQVSAHYLVNAMDDKEIYLLVDENKRAYHAGVSAWRNDKNLNDTSIGIEIVNDGYKVDSTGKKVFLAFDENQMKKVGALAKDIVKRYQIPPTNVLAHSDIAPTRKQDPGALFPWKMLYDDYQIGMWYDADQVNLLKSKIITDFDKKYNQSSFIFLVQKELQKLGYGIELSGQWDATTKKTIEAFQYHFRPENYDGIVDVETLAILQALNSKYSIDR